MTLHVPGPLQILTHATLPWNPYADKQQPRSPEFGDAVQESVPGRVTQFPCRAEYAKGAEALPVAVRNATTPTAPGKRRLLTMSYR
jgi:hypothetical protein